MAKTTSGKMLNKKDKEEISWATEYTLAQCGDAPVECETLVDISVDGEFFTRGYVDMICPSRRKIFDLKTGQRYDDRIQLSGYALGWMQKTECMEIECHLVYSAESKVDRWVVTRSEAEDIARRVRNRITNPTASPIPNMRCGWCRHQPYCTAHEKTALTIIDRQDMLEKARNPAEITSPLTAARLREYVPSIEAWIKALKEKCDTFDELPGFKKVTRTYPAKIEDSEAVYKLLAGHNIGTYNILRISKIKYPDLVATFAECTGCTTEEAEQALPQIIGNELSGGGKSSYWRKVSTVK
tara:strand:+ start:1829 stop:2722 length:894 start_codon:yes stop_codon:yes gene_type:complete